MSSFPSSFQSVVPRSPRHYVRHAALDALGLIWKARGWIDSALRRSRVHFIYLHHCYPDEEEGLRQLLRRLSKDHEFIPYSEAVRRVVTGQRARPCVSISFDDGVRNTLAAARILEEFGARGCFFVCPGIVGVTDARKLEAFCRDRLQFVPTEFLSWREIESLMERGHEIGGHTMTHARLATMKPDEWGSEIDRCFTELRSRIGDIRHFAWPFGLFKDASASAVAAVYQAGFETCASAERGCHVVPHSQPLRSLCLRRETIIAGWPLRHSLYLMARSARRASVADNDWPASLVGSVP